MLNLAAEGIGVIMCGILSVTPVTPIPVNPYSINALEIKKETVSHQNEIRENSQADPIEIKIFENTNRRTGSFSISSRIPFERSKRIVR